MIRHLIYIVLSCGLFAQTTGKISGLIKDKSDSSPLPGANVYIENSSFGTASDENGRFTLINIPPGKYNLKIDMIGYKSMKMENSPGMISLTFTTTLKPLISELSRMELW